MERYLKATETIDCAVPAIREKARSLTGGSANTKQKAIALFHFVRDEIKFNAYAPGDLIEYNRASVVLERGHGFCYQKAILLVALARATGIPARLGFADIRNHLLSEKFLDRMYGSNLLVYHGYAELYIDGRWVVATPAYDLKMCQENGFIPVDFDGENDARFHPCNRQGQVHIEYVRGHGHYEDLPWEEILNARDELVAQLGIDVSEFMAKWKPDPPDQENRAS